MRKLLLPVLGLACLALSVASLKAADVFSARARSALQAARTRLADAEQLERAALANAARLARADHFVAQAVAAGFSFREWDERRFNLRQATMDRASANALFTEISRSPDRFFAAEQFDVSVKRPDESLFATPADAASEVVVTLKGSMLFRAKKDDEAGKPEKPEKPEKAEKAENAEKASS